MGFVLHTVKETLRVNLPLCQQLYVDNKALLNFYSLLSECYAREISVYTCDISEHGKEKYSCTLKSSCSDQRNTDRERPQGAWGGGGGGDEEGKTLKGSQGREGDTRMRY